MVRVAARAPGAAYPGRGAPRWDRDANDDRLLAQAPGLDVPAQLPAGGRPGALFDPIDLPVDAARPPSVGARAIEGIYTAVFSGVIEVSNPSGRVLVPVGQGAFVPPAPTLPPQLLPAAPLFMERDRELERGRLFPGQCPR